MIQIMSEPVKRTLSIGTCGFGLAQADYAQLFSCVEVQQTFYQPPQVLTLERWRRNTPPAFEFTLKAWQLITHEATSPTYRRLKKKLSEEEKREAGSFQSTRVVQEAWEVTLACAKALHARAILFQCPASFRQTRENIANLKRFFGSIEREEHSFGWEPRGEWDSHAVKRICDDLQLWHVVDPFVRTTETPDHCYFRLHGKTGWRYRYGEDELAELAGRLAPCQDGYVFFNNSDMTEDALRFKRLVEERHG